MSIANEITRLNTAKSNLRTAIQNKGVDVPLSATIDTYYTYVNQIVTGSGGGGNTCIGKFKLSYNNNTIYGKDCDGSTTITSGETRPENFDYSAVTSIELGNCVTELGENAFSGFSNVNEITIPSGVTTIGDKALYINGLTVNMESVTPPALDGNSVFYPFYGMIYVPCEAYSAYTADTAWSAYASRIATKCDKVILRENVFAIKKFIGRLPCDHQRIDKTDFPSGWTSANTISFGDCDYIYFNANAFIDFTSLDTIYMPKNYIYASQAPLFADERPLAINFPDDCVVTTINAHTFQNCGISAITLPASITTIGAYAFERCTGLRTVTMKSTTPPTLGNYVFIECPLWDIYVPAESVEAYKAANGWSDYAAIIKAIP